MNPFIKSTINDVATQCLWWQRDGVMGGEVAGPPFLNGRKQRNLWHEVFLCPMFFILHRKYNIYITNAKYIYPHDAPWGNDASVPWYRAGFGAEGAAFRLSGSAVLHAFLGGVTGSGSSGISEIEVLS